MADVRLLFPAEYLSAAWLKGRDVTFTIVRVEQDDLKTDRGTEKKPVVRFAELDERRQQDKTVPRAWVLNKTNAKTIARLYGNETNDWIGKRITLYPTTCTAFKDVVDCIRVRDVAPGPKKKKPDPEPAAFDEPDPADLEAAS